MLTYGWEERQLLAFTTIKQHASKDNEMAGTFRLDDCNTEHARQGGPILPMN